MMIKALRRISLGGRETEHGIGQSSITQPGACWLPGRGSVDRYRAPAGDPCDARAAPVAIVVPAPAGARARRSEPVDLRRAHGARLARPGRIARDGEPARQAGP